MKLLAKFIIFLRKIFQSNIFLVLVIFFCFLTIFIYHVKSSHFFIVDHHNTLAKSFLKKHIAIDAAIFDGSDIAEYNGKAYLYFGPLPALLLTPFVKFITPNFSQYNLTLFFTPIIFLCIYKLGQMFRLKKYFSLWLAIFFVFGTVYTNLAALNIAAYISQIVGIAFVFLSLLNFYAKKNWFITGLFIGFAILSRFILVFYIIFFILKITQLKQVRHEKIKRIAIFSLPIFVSLVIQGAYNFFRFGNWFETGYTHMVSLKENYLISKYGLFSMRYIITNLYYYFLASPALNVAKTDGLIQLVKFPFLKVSPFGLSIFLQSPLLILTITNFHLLRNNISIIISLTFLSVPSLFFYAPGFAQFGYRYALDVLPLLFVVLFYSLKKYENSISIKLLILYSILFNFLLMPTIWEKIIVGWSNNFWFSK